VTLNPGQTAVLSLQFDPTTAGAATGLVTITSNAASGATQTITLTGTGVAPTSYEVQLSWTAPASSTDPVVSYNVYRSTGTGSYQKLNTAVNTPTTYTDTTVQSGSTYNYEVTSVDASGVESAPSNVYTAAIP
jgi:fibronectin type 3 domain-containing protein